MGQNVDYIVDAIVILISLGICLLLYWGYDSLIVQPELKKIRMRILNLIQEKRFRDADFLLFCARKRWPKKKIFQISGKKNDSQILYDLERMDEECKVEDNDFYERFERYAMEGMPAEEMNQIQHLLQMQGDYKSKKKFIIIDIIFLVFSILLTLSNTIYHPIYFYWVNICPFIYLFAIEMIIVALYLLKKLNKKLASYTFYHALLGLYFTIWTFSYAFSFTSELSVITSIFGVLLIFDILFIAWLYRRRTTVFRRKKIIPPIFPALNLLLIVSEVLTLVSAYIINFFFSRQVGLIGFYFVILGILFFMQLLNFADYQYFRKYRQYQENMNLIQRYKDNQNKS